MRTGAEFGEFLEALGASKGVDAGMGEGKRTPIEIFLDSHPAALAFVQVPKPFPVSFGMEAYFGLNAFKFIAAAGDGAGDGDGDGDGKTTFVRYEFVPVAGLSHLSDDEARGKGADYLAEEIMERIALGPVGMKLLVQIAEEGDVVDDVTVQWPAERGKVELGTVWLDKIDEHGLETQRKVIFDPIPRVEGIEASEDPLLDFRAALYLNSGRERRAAGA